MLPEDVLKGYWTAMHQWEAECEGLDRECRSGTLDFRESMRIGLELHRPIFEKYCSVSKAARRESLEFASPLEYDPSAQTITSVNLWRAGIANVRTYHATHDRALVY